MEARVLLVAAPISPSTIVTFEPQHVGHGAQIHTLSIALSLTCGRRAVDAVLPCRPWLAGIA